MKICKVILSVAGTAFFACCMFFSFVAGAPGPQEKLPTYTFLAAGFSVLVPVFVCAGIHYILHLQKHIEELENNRRNK